MKNFLPFILLASVAANGLAIFKINSLNKRVPVVAQCTKPEAAVDPNELNYCKKDLNDTLEANIKLEDEIEDVNTQLKTCLDFVQQAVNK